MGRGSIGQGFGKKRSSEDKKTGKGGLAEFGRSIKNAFGIMSAEDKRKKIEQDSEDNERRQREKHEKEQAERRQKQSALDAEKQRWLNE